MTPRELLAKARIATFDYMPYASSFVYSLREQETPGIGTAAVTQDGRLFWDPAFIQQISTEQGAYLILHETLHLLLEHHARAVEIIGENASEFHRYVCNVAGDLVIEQLLAMMRHLRPEGAIHLGCTIDAWEITLDFPENLSMQTYYALILKKLQQQAEAGGSQQQGDTSERADENEGSGGSDGQHQEGRGNSASRTSQSKSRGDMAAQFIPDDDGTTAEGNAAHSPDSSRASGAGSQQGIGAPGSGGSCADGQRRDYETESDGTWEAYGSDMAAARTEQSVAEYEATHPGSVPGVIKAALKCKLRPQPDPFDQLRSAVCTSVASPVGGRDFSRRRRSRKQPPEENVPLLHGRITVQPHAVVIVDTSASMLGSKTKAKALSVIGQGLRKLSRVKVFCADTQVQSAAVVADTNRFEWCGGGGTDMSTAIAEVDRSDHPDSIILVTDAETDWHGRKPRARVVVAYTGTVGSAWHHNIPKWCRVIPLERSNA